MRILSFKSYPGIINLLNNLIDEIKYLIMKKLFFLLYCMLVPIFRRTNNNYLKADSSKQRINKNIYGHFAEHLGRCIYDGFYVGDSNKTIPNTDGVRNDVIAALRK